MRARGAKIHYLIVLPLRGPIEERRYFVGDKAVDVSYPPSVQIGFPTPVILPSTSTRFDVHWTDKKGATTERLASNTFERFTPLEDALHAINRLIEAFMLVRVGHADGLRLRSIGRGDSLLYAVAVDGVPTGIVNCSLRITKDLYPWAALEREAYDPNGTTDLALQHIAADTFALARRYLRCFDLVEHGYHSEALIIAHSILDDTVQTAIDAILREKGLTEASGRDLIIRGIKEQRLKSYLGPLLKILTGKTVEEMWPPAVDCLDWLNRTRNTIAHRGGECEQRQAAWGIFASIRLVAVLAKNGVISAEFPRGMMRHARILASWTIDAPKWVPAHDLTEQDDFDPYAT